MEALPLSERGLLSVSEAARELGVSAQRVRALVADGRLDAYRAGRVLLIPAESLADRAAAAPGGGRPWSAAMAWAALLLLDGDPAGADALGSRDRWRLRQRLAAADDLLGLAPRFVNRAAVRPFAGHSSIPARIVGDGVRSGISAAGVLGLDLIDDGSVADVYVPAGMVAGLRDRYRLVPAAGRAANVLLRVVADDAWALAGRQVAPRGAVALDLAHANDSRSRAAAVQLAARVWVEADW